MTHPRGAEHALFSGLRYPNAAKASPGAAWLEPRRPRARQRVLVAELEPLHREPFAGFPSRALFAVHDDQAVAAFDWRDIVAATGLTEGCAGT